jgi:hypothetical protein
MGPVPVVAMQPFGQGSLAVFGDMECGGVLVPIAPVWSPSQGRRVSGREWSADGP